MNPLMNELEEWGCNVEDAMNRFLDDVELYTDCLQEFSKDPGFVNFEETVSGEDHQAAFDCVHTLKGVSANLGLTPLFSKLEILTEELRAKRYDNLEPLAKDVMTEYENYCKIMKL